MRGRAGRVHVVDKDDHSGRSAVRKEGLRDIASSRSLTQAALARRASGPPEQRLEWQSPGSRKLACEPLGRVVASRQAPIGVAGDTDETGRTRPFERLAHDLGRPRGEAPQPTLLPGGDELLHGRVIRDRSPSPGERHSPARAFRAAADRPGRGRTAALAEGRHDSGQRVATRTTDLRARLRADEAALRQEQIEHGLTVSAEPCRVCGSSADVLAVQSPFWSRRPTAAGA
jgi:hypothetical protein